jgi:hypothetical protein
MIFWLYRCRLSVVEDDFINEGKSYAFGTSRYIKAWAAHHEEWLHPACTLARPRGPHKLPTSRFHPREMS